MWKASLLLAAVGADFDDAMVAAGQRGQRRAHKAGPALQDVLRVPVRTGYMYSGHVYVPFPLFFFESTGRKWISGIGENSSIGAGSCRNPCSPSQRAPSR